MGQRLTAGLAAGLSAEERRAVAAALPGARWIDERGLGQDRAERLIHLSLMDIRLASADDGTDIAADAAWMGVATVTAARSGGGGSRLNTLLGLDALNAGDAVTLARTAAELCGDHNRLARLRAGLRLRVQAAGPSLFFSR